MQLNRLAFPALALFLGAVSPNFVRAAANPAEPAIVFSQERPWDMPPNEFNEIQRRGFHDGIEGARRDWGNHRPPNVENRDEYRNPNMPRDQAEAYREGFRRGYQVGVSRFYGNQAMPVPPSPPPAWDMPPNEFNDVQRQGFRDGMVGAQRDFGNHRNPNPNNRDEYRHPNQPPELRQAYREGFQRGYWRTMNHLMGRPYQY